MLTFSKVEEHSLGMSVMDLDQESLPPLATPQVFVYMKELSYTFENRREN